MNFISFVKVLQRYGDLLKQPTDVPRTKWNRHFGVNLDKAKAEEPTAPLPEDGVVTNANDNDKNNGGTAVSER